MEPILLKFQDGYKSVEKSLLLHFPYFRELFSGKWITTNMFSLDFPMADFESIIRNITRGNNINYTAYNLMEFLQFEGYEYTYEVKVVNKKTAGMKNLLSYNNELCTLTTGDISLPIRLQNDSIFDCYDNVKLNNVGHLFHDYEFIKDIKQVENKFKCISGFRCAGNSYHDIKLKFKIAKILPQFKLKVECYQCKKLFSLYFEINVERN